MTFAKAPSVRDTTMGCFASVLQEHQEVIDRRTWEELQEHQKKHASRTPVQEVMNLRRSLRDASGKGGTLQPEPQTLGGGAPQAPPQCGGKGDGRGGGAPATALVTDDLLGSHQDTSPAPLLQQQYKFMAPDVVKHPLLSPVAPALYAPPLAPAPAPPAALVDKLSDLNVSQTLPGAVQAPGPIMQQPARNSTSRGQSVSVPLNSLGLPVRTGSKVCRFYAMGGLRQCKYGASCKFHHPEPDIPVVKRQPPRPIVLDNAPVIHGGHSQTTVTSSGVVVALKIDKNMNDFGFVKLAHQHRTDEPLVDKRRNKNTTQQQAFVFLGPQARGGFKTGGSSIQSAGLTLVVGDQLSGLVFRSGKNGDSSETQTRTTRVSKSTQSYPSFNKIKFASLRLTYRGSHPTRDRTTGGDWLAGRVLS